MPGVLFTPETASEMGKRGAAARTANFHAIVKAAYPPPPEAIESCLARRLNRVRAQLDMIDDRIDEQVSKSTVDGQAVNWLCSAQERLAEQERILAGRPLPGSRRPTPERAAARSPGAWLSDPAPTAPQVVPAAAARPAGWEYDDPNASPTCPACGPDTPTGSVPDITQNVQTPQDQVKA